MNTTRSPRPTFKSVSTLLLSAACTAGVSALVIIGPQIAWSADSTAPHGNPAGSSEPPSTVNTPCFMTPTSWSVAETGALPTCAREVGASSSIQAETVSNNRPPAGKAVLVYDAPCFMTPLTWPTAEVGPVPRCARFASR